jgi:hypothetical protein
MAEKIMELCNEMWALMKIPIARGCKTRPQEMIKEFKEKHEMTMKFWPRNALDIMTIEEDKLFLRSMMSDRKASMGGIDKPLSITEKKVALRQKLEEKRYQKEREQQKKQSESLVDLVSDDTDDDNSSEYEPDDVRESGRRSHHRTKKTGTDVHIPFDILHSEELVSTAVRNKISPTVLSATVHSLIKACHGDSSKVNLSSSQTYRYWSIFSQNEFYTSYFIY